MEMTVPRIQRSPTFARAARHLAAVALASSAILAGGARTANGEVIDRVLAIVAGDLILQSDVAAAREFGLTPPAGAPDPVREILTRLIDRALVLDEVERYTPPEPDEAAIGSDLAAVRSRFPTEEAYRAALVRVGLEERQLRERLRQDRRIAAYLAQRFTLPDTAADGDGRNALVDEWMAGLRRRADIVDLYEPSGR